MERHGLRLGRLQREILVRMLSAPGGETGEANDPVQICPDGANRAEREAYTRALRRLQDEGLAWRFPRMSRGGKGNHIRSTLTKEGVAVAAQVQRSDSYSANAGPGRATENAIIQKLRV
jgi:hypothetical protein